MEKPAARSPSAQSWPPARLNHQGASRLPSARPPCTAPNSIVSGALAGLILNSCVAEQPTCYCPLRGVCCCEVHFWDVARESPASHALTPPTLPSYFQLPVVSLLLVGGFAKPKVWGGCRGGGGGGRRQGGGGSEAFLTSAETTSQTLPLDLNLSHPSIESSSEFPLPVTVQIF